MLSETREKVDEGSPAYVSYLRDKYKYKFKRIGNLKEFEVELHENPEAKPIIQLKRRVPFHVREKVTKEMDKQEAAGMIEAVDQSMKASLLWIDYLKRSS